MSEARKSSAAPWLAGIGGLLGGSLVYVSLAGLGGGVTWRQRLTFDQAGELELEAIAIFWGLILGVLVGVNLGTYISLRTTKARRPGVTALSATLLTAGATMLAFWTMPSRSSAPIVLPYVVFGSWFLLPLLTAMIVSE